MSITVECPHCGQRHELEAEAAGTLRRCDCGGKLRVPGARTPRRLWSPRDATNRLSLKSKLMVSALLGVVILGVVLHLVRDIHWHIAAMDPAAPIVLPRTELSMSELIARLSDEDSDVRGSACRKLGEHGERAIRPLMNVLRADNDKTRAAARKALVDISEPAVPELLKALVGEDVSVATEAAWALGEIGDPRAVKPLLSEFEDHVAAAASHARPTVDPSRPQSVDPRDRHEYAARAIAKALGELEATEAAYPLLMALGTRGKRLDSSITTALVAMGEGALPVLKENLWHVGPEARKAIINVTTELENPLPEEDLLRLLGSDEHVVSLAAARTLVSRGDKRPLPVLIRAVEEEWPEGLRKAIEMLAELGDTRAVPAIISALDHGSWYARVDAAKALGELGHRDAVEPLIALLSDEDENRWVVTAVATALGQIGDRRAIEPLTAAMSQDKFGVEASVIGALGAIEGTDAIPMLIDQLDGGYSMSGNAARQALVSMGEASAPALVQALSDGRRQVRHHALEALRDMGDVALDALISGLETAEGEPHARMLDLLRLLALKHPRAQQAIDRAKAERLSSEP